MAIHHIDMQHRDLVSNLFDCRAEIRKVCSKNGRSNLGITDHMSESLGEWHKPRSEGRGSRIRQGDVLADGGEL
jgi:hypothetical protein